jgi:hypothetical protein
MAVASLEMGRSFPAELTGPSVGVGRRYWWRGLVQPSAGRGNTTRDRVNKHERMCVCVCVC